MLSKKNFKIILLAMIVLAAIVCLAVFLFFISKNEGEVKKQIAPIQKQEKILTPEEKKQELLEYLRKKEEAMSPEELALEKAEAEQKRQELLEYLRKKEEAEKIKQQ